MKTLDDIMNELSPSDRAKIEERARKLIEDAAWVPLVDLVRFRDERGTLDALRRASDQLGITMSDFCREAVDTRLKSMGIERDPQYEYPPPRRGRPLRKGG